MNWIVGILEAIQAVGRVIGVVRDVMDEKPKTLKQNMIEAGHVILKRSNYYCPKDTGRLVNSGQVIAGGTDDAPTVSVVYSTPYAVYVHEDLDAYHAPPTQAKFLQRGFRETYAEVSRILQSGKAHRVKYNADQSVQIVEAVVS